MESSRRLWVRAFTMSALFIPIAFIMGVFFSSLNNTAFADISCTVQGGSTTSSVDFRPFWRAWQLIDQKYVGTTSGISTTTEAERNSKRLWGAIHGMVAAVGDPYTEFLPPQEKKLFEEEIHGSFGGVGMELGLRNGVITVIAPLPDTPATRADIRAGDRITHIGTESASGMSIDGAISRIRGKVGTPITITFNREGVNAPITATMTRAVITIPIIDTKSYPDSIFYIRLYSFSENSPELFRQALLGFIKSGNTKLILDLRGNPGGYLDASVAIASWFLPQGSAVVREQIGPERKEMVHLSIRGGVFSKNRSMIILIDKGSASASEILAGSLSEYGVATLVGEKTFGKGSVQELISVTADTSLKVTVARWLTPNGVSISERGLTPHVVVPISDDDIKAKRDPQLDRALLILRGR